MPDLRSPVQHAIAMRRVDPDTNVARFYVLTLERDLFGSSPPGRRSGELQCEARYGLRACVNVLTGHREPNGTVSSRPDLALPTLGVPSREGKKLRREPAHHALDFGQCRRCQQDPDRTRLRRVLQSSTC